MVSSCYTQHPSFHLSMPTLRGVGGLLYDFGRAPQYKGKIEGNPIEHTIAETSFFVATILRSFHSVKDSNATLVQISSEFIFYISLWNAFPLQFIKSTEFFFILAPDKEALFIKSFFTAKV